MPYRKPATRPPVDVEIDETPLVVEAPPLRGVRYDTLADGSILVPSTEVTQLVGIHHTEEDGERLVRLALRLEGAPTWIDSVPSLRTPDGWLFRRT